VINVSTKFLLCSQHGFACRPTAQVPGYTGDKSFGCEGGQKGRTILGGIQEGWQKWGNKGAAKLQSATSAVNPRYHIRYHISAEGATYIQHMTAFSTYLDHH